MSALFVLGQCLEYHWQISAGQVEGIFLAQQKMRSDQAVPQSERTLSSICLQFPGSWCNTHHPKFSPMWRTVLPWIHHADAFSCMPRATQVKTMSGLLWMHPCCLGQSPGCPLDKPWALGGTRHCQSSSSEPAWKGVLVSPSSSGQRYRAWDWGQDSILLPALGIFFHPAPPPHPVLVGFRKISKQGP